MRHVLGRRAPKPALPSRRGGRLRRTTKPAWARTRVRRRVRPRVAGRRRRCQSHGRRPGSRPADTPGVGRRLQPTTADAGRPRL